ncbi:Predicted alpha-1,6-mannanase, GH76 family [Chitinophaga terrae (ex Kim and Jung 2007)]|uniref:Predicted alpha-1,6-mannanase, GH76 family n=1 Tax=Chitinophaga terrae (ex Kim and Jung 2007) TaxID=408074 RepID=A0A1H4FLN5_9BACT|nr:glycoside hydrolase family 76 protein [Chitinophaga terrae (ex Kim and Jung 2007)]MDQ0108763.1 putative alpha-1,6-mannanase (GH76 family) [Chitinophaga terrae (ex Kim and Jung 2007)]GEP89044.1 alpha-1,6-mannanase [Chitinophaga terrae (ex Kim and Jung 2007)]SEA98185.1 Predicted alpha-1,6-mannanase, GH76 family [Chitinophaga terrae (ex Kim and Jung 2007)]
MKAKYLSILLLPLAFTACLKEPVDDGPGPGAGKERYVYNWPQIADSATQGLLNNYWNQDKYFNANNSGNATFNYWPNAHALDVLVDAYIRKNDPAIKTRMDDLLAGMKVKNGNTYINHFYDDMEWMTLACLRAFEATGDTKYKDVAVLLWNDIKGGWDDVWGGGIHWNKDKSKNYKNTPANAPACIIAARMYGVTQNADDIAWAKKIYDWQKSTLVDPVTGLVWDGINQDGSGNVTKNWNFTYNQGVFIGAGVELYKLTGQQVYLNDALKTANNALGGTFTNANILKDEGAGDGGLFKGILVRYLMLLITDGGISSTDAAKFANFLQLNAETLWVKGTAKPQVIFNKNWTTIAANSDLTEQLSGEMVIDAAYHLKQMGLIK